MRETVLVTFEVTATPQPTQTPAPQPTSTPVPQTAAHWTPDQVLAAFMAAGLGVEQTRPLTRDDYGRAPLAGSGVRFFLPSLRAECGGRVFSLENAVGLARVNSHYDEMGQYSAMFLSWTFSRHNILVQIDGDLPEAQAKQYEAALMDMKLNSMGCRPWTCAKGWGIRRMQHGR